MSNIIFITSRLDEVHGGLTASMLKKAKLFYEEKGEKVKILTFHADPNFEKVRKNVLEKYALEGKVDIFNINDYYRHSKNDYGSEKYSIRDTYQYVYKVNDKRTEYYNPNGIKAFEVIEDKNQLREVLKYDVYGEMIEKHQIDSEGYLFAKNYYKNGFLSAQTLFTKSHEPFLTRRFDWKNRKNSIVELVLFDESPKKFSSFDNFKANFIDKFVEKPITYLVVEARGMDPAVINMKNQYIRKIFMTHSIHIRPSTDIIRAGNRATLNNLNNVDAMIFLTESQKNDVIKRFGFRDNYFVIPHAIDQKEIKHKSEHNRISIVSRLHEEKRLNHAIEAFSKVIKKIPDATLHIYGDGKVKSELKELIKELNVQEAVFLEGHTDQVDEVIQRSECTVLTSKYEGFALVVQESIANGIPVISYDIKYGPSDMIENGKNGYLVEEGNITELADTIIKYLSKSDKEKEEFKSNSIEKSKQFSKRKFIKRWSEVLEEVKEQKDYFTPYVTLNSLDKRKLSKSLKIKLSVSVKSSSKIKPNFEMRLYKRSTLSDKEKKQFYSLKLNVRKVNDANYVIESIINPKNLESHEIFDLSLAINYKSQFHEIRVGNIRDSIDLKQVRSKKVEPYFTNPHDNLSIRKYK